MFVYNKYFLIENMNVIFYQPGITPNRVTDKPVHHVSVVFDLAWPWKQNIFIQPVLEVNKELF